MVILLKKVAPNLSILISVLVLLKRTVSLTCSNVFTTFETKNLLRTSKKQQNLFFNHKLLPYISEVSELTIVEIIAYICI